jgi:DNA-binding NarL/FixJ family response regulator
VSVIPSSEHGPTIDPDDLKAIPAKWTDPGVDLTPMEKKVVVGVGLGKSTKAIARDLGIAVQTVKDHITAIGTKLGPGSNHREKIGRYYVAIYQGSTEGKGSLTDYP